MKIVPQTVCDNDGRILVQASAKNSESWFLTGTWTYPDAQ